MTRQEFDDWLRTDEGWEAARPAFDRYANKAIDTHDEKQRIAGGDVGELRAENQKLKIDRAVTEGCRTRGLDEGMVTDLELTFEDIADVEPRLEKIAARLGVSIQDGINRQLSTGHRPGSGNEAPPTKKAGELTDTEAVFFEELGELDAMIER